MNKKTISLILLITIFLIVLNTLALDFTDGSSSGNMSFRDVNTTVRYINLTTQTNTTSVFITMAGFVNLTQNTTFSLPRTNYEGEIQWNGSKYHHIADKFAPTNAELVATSNLSKDPYSFNDEQWNFSFVDITTANDEDVSFAFNGSELYFLNNTDLADINLIRTDFPTHPIGIVTSYPMPDNTRGITFANGSLYSCNSVDGIIRKHDKSDFSVVVENFTPVFPTSCISITYDNTTLWVSGAGGNAKATRLNSDNYSIEDFRSLDTRTRTFWDGSDLYAYSTSGTPIIKYFGRGFPLDLYIDGGNDSIIDYISSENIKETTVISLNFTNFNDYMTANCVGESFCTIPIIFNSTGGMWAYSDFRVGYDSTLSISIFDEVTDEIIIQNSTIIVVGLNTSSNYSTDNGTLFLANMDFGENRITYSSKGYTERDHYITILNGSESTAKLYLLSGDNGTEITFSIQDSSGNSLENALIKLKRFYVATNSYTTVAMSKTNFEGETIIDVDFNDAFYETLTTFGDFSQSTRGSRIISTTFFITLNLLGDPFQDITEVVDVASSISFNNNTQTFSYVFNSLSGGDKTGTIEVHKITPIADDIVCTSTDTSSSSTVLCQVNTTDITGTYVAKGLINIRGIDVMTKSIQVTTGAIMGARAIFGNQRGFMAVILMGTMASLGAFGSPALAIILFLLGMGIAVFFKFAALSISVYVTIVIIGFMIIWKLKQ